MIKYLTCIMCPIGCQVTVSDDSGALVVTGNTCKRGEVYAKQEMVAPQRVVTALFPLVGGGVVPCKTNGTVPKEKIFAILREIQAKNVAKPVAIGQVLLPDVLGLGVDIVATSAR